jgi:hypothetical protein
MPAIPPARSAESVGARASATAARTATPTVLGKIAPAAAARRVS